MIHFSITLHENILLRENLSAGCVLVKENVLASKKLLGYKGI